MKKKQFQVWFDYSETGKTIVTAKSSDEALLQIREYLSEYGLDGLKYSCTDREYNAQLAEKI